MDSSMNEIIMELVRAFLVGGIICALVQVLLDRTKMMPGRVMVTLVVTGNILGWLGLYEPFLKWAGAGAGVPLLAGIAAALVFGYLGALVFKPKMKE